MVVVMVVVVVMVYCFIHYTTLDITTCVFHSYYIT